MKKIIILLCAVFYLSSLLKAQDCEVLLDSLKGKYTGACNKGKADGEGKAEGVDSFSGNFKKGLPDGEGRYTWKNGNWYKGFWKKGIQNGKGEMHYLKTGLPDSIVTGFWKAGIYAGLYEKPYDVFYRSEAVTDVRVTRDSKSTLNELIVRVSNTTGNTAGIRSGFHPVIKLISQDVKEGFFNLMQKQETGNYKNFYTFRSVTYPLRIQLYFERNHSVDIEFYEAGEWTVDVIVND